MPSQQRSSSATAKAGDANGDAAAAVSFLADKSAKVFVAGHRGMVGSAVHRKLDALGFTNVVVRTRAELDLACQPAVEAFFAAERPRYVILAAAKVGGVHASSAAPAEYLTENLRITVNVVDAARRCGSVRKLLFLASSTIYPSDAPQPTPESALLSGPPAAGSEWYAIPKIAGIKMCQAYRAEFGMDAIAAAPNNLYGPRHPFPSEQSHVIPALIRRFHDAKRTGAGEVAVWGSGAAAREFTHVDDVADAVVVLMERYSGEEHVNVGSGEEVTVRELAEAVREVVGYEGRVAWDARRPDGVARRLVDSGRMRKLGWEPRVALRDGIEELYRFYLRHECGGQGHAHARLTRRHTPPSRARSERHGDDDDDRDGDGGGAAAPPGREVLWGARGGGGRRRCRGGGGGRGAVVVVVVLGGGEEGGVAAADAVRGVAGLFEGQRVHPRALPLRVVRPRRAAQRLRLAQRDPQRLDPSGRLLPVPVARRRRRDGGGDGRGRRAGDHDVLGGVISQQRVVGDQQHELGGEGFAGVVGRRRRPCAGEVAADGVPGGRHDVPGGERDGAPPGVPLAQVQPPLLATGLRRHRRHDRRLLLPSGILRVPRPGRGAGGLPVGDHRAGVACGGGAAGAGEVVAAAAAHPRGAVRVHGALRRRAGAARAVAQLGTPGVLPGAVAGAGDGARVRRRRGVLRGARAGAVAAGDVRLRRPQPPDLPRARARRRAHALRRHRDSHRLARGGDRHRRRGILVTRHGRMCMYVRAIDYSFIIFMYVAQVILWTPDISEVRCVETVNVRDGLKP